MSTNKKNTIIDGLKNIFTTSHKLHKLLINTMDEASRTCINHGFTTFVRPVKWFCGKITIFIHIFKIQNVVKLKKTTKLKMCKNWLRLVCWHPSMLFKHLKREIFVILWCFRRANSDTGICPFKDKANFKCVGWNNSKQVENKRSSPNTYKVNSEQT